MSEEDIVNQEISRRLANIEHRVDSIDQTNAFALRKDRDAHIKEVLKIFGRSERRAQVYLVADGLKTVNQIADHIGISRQQVTPILTYLGDEGILELKRSEGSSDYWGKKAIERTLRISKVLKEKFSLGDSGEKLT